MCTFTISNSRQQRYRPFRAGPDSALKVLTDLSC